MNVLRETDLLIGITLLLNIMKMLEQGVFNIDRKINQPKKIFSMNMITG